MAYFHIKNVKIDGLAVAVPKTTVSNSDLVGYEEAELNKIISTLGIENRRIATADQCASDLCMEASNKLIAQLGWDKSDIEVLFFVTQTPDYTLPGTSMYIKEQLGLSKECVTFDINQGCAGYVYGLSLISSFLSAGGIKKGLLLVGDTISKLISPFDRSLIPIFSDAGSATALCYDESASDMMFNITVDGANFDAILVPQGGARNPFTEASLEYVTYDGNIKRKGIHLAMNGLKVLNFSLQKVAQNVKQLLGNAGNPQVDYYIFHQANALILESIRKKINVDVSRMPASLKDYGNTSSATIPLTIVHKLENENNIPDARLLLSGFGVGLSLASVLVDFKHVVALPIIEL